MPKKKKVDKYQLFAEKMRTPWFALLVVFLAFSVGASIYLRIRQV